MNSERYDYHHKYNNYGPIQGNIINEHFGQNLVDKRQESNEKLMHRTLWKRKNSERPNDQTEHMYKTFQMQKPYMPSPPVAVRNQYSPGDENVYDSDIDQFNTTKQSGFTQNVLTNQKLATDEKRTTFQTSMNETCRTDLFPHLGIRGHLNEKQMNDYEFEK